MKILLVEDDHVYSESIEEFLNSLGFQTDLFFDGESALDAVMSREYHLLIVDIKLPKLNGHKLIKEIRDANIKTPIVVITSLLDIESLTLSYELGCNDYIKKPFELKELQCRIREIIKNTYKTDSESKIHIDKKYVFDMEKGILKKNSEVIELTAKELQIIYFLLCRKNTYCGIELLREIVWENKEISYANIRMHMRKIRGKTSEHFIKSARGLGYKIDVLG